MSNSQFVTLSDAMLLGFQYQIGRSLSVQFLPVIRIWGQDWEIGCNGGHVYVEWQYWYAGLSEGFLQILAICTLILSFSRPPYKWGQFERIFKQLVYDMFKHWKPRLVALMDEKLVNFIYPTVVFVDKDWAAVWIKVCCEEEWLPRICCLKRSSPRLVQMLGRTNLSFWCFRAQNP